MATITLKGNPIHTHGDLPAVGSKAPDFALLLGGGVRKSLKDYAGKTLLLNIFPSVDTGICAMSTRAFNERAAGRTDVTVACVSADLPFAFARFCGAEGIKNVVTLSTFEASFGLDYGTRLIDGPMVGFMARSVVVIDGAGVVRYTELVPEIVQEPNYDAALAAVAALG